MSSRLFIRDELAARAEAMRRLHSDWLTRALRARSGMKLPRIPTRRVEEGGFDSVMASPEGRQWASEFWHGTLEGADAE